MQSVYRSQSWKKYSCPKATNFRHFSGFVHLFEDGTKLRTTSEIIPPLHLIVIEVLY